MPRLPRFGPSAHPAEAVVDEQTGDAPAESAAQTPAPTSAAGDDAQVTTVMATVPLPAAAVDSADSGAEDGAVDGPADVAPEAGAAPGFAERARLRRRLRFLRRARELGFRDLGGLVFDLNRFGRSREDLVRGKIETLTNIDQELRALERALGNRDTTTILHEPGLVACPRCAAIHGTDTNFCPNCGLPTGRRAAAAMALPGDGAPEGGAALAATGPGVRPRLDEPAATAPAPPAVEPVASSLRRPTEAAGPVAPAPTPVIGPGRPRSTDDTPPAR